MGVQPFPIVGKIREFVGVSEKTPEKDGIYMERKHNSSLTEYARELRKNMTEEERILWFRYLRNHPARFQRQKVLGKYIADFYSASASLVVELDGSQHFEDPAMQYDTERTSFLEQYGLTVLRIPNNAVRENLSGVCEYIDLYIEKGKHP